MYSEGEEDYDDKDGMSNFIVEGGEDEDEKVAGRDRKKRLQRKRKIFIDSDDDIEEDDMAVIFGHVQPTPAVLTGEVRTMSRFLPSTKMKVDQAALVRIAN